MRQAKEEFVAVASVALATGILANTQRTSMSASDIASLARAVATELAEQAGLKTEAELERR